MGAASARRRQRGGLYSRRFSLSTPFFQLSAEPKLEAQDRNFFFSNRHLPQSSASCGAAVISDGRVIGAAFRGVNSQNDKSAIFRFTPREPPSGPSRSVYSTRARQLSSGKPHCPIQGGSAGKSAPVENSFPPVLWWGNCFAPAMSRQPWRLA